MLNTCWVLAIKSIVIFYLLTKKHVFLEYGTERSLLCSLSNILLLFFLEMSFYWASGKKKKSLSFSQHSTEPVTVQYKCQFRCVRRCFGRLLHINCSCVPAFNRCAGIASCMQGAGCAGARQKQRQSVLKSPEPKGRWLFVWSPDRLSLTGFLSGSWLRCCTQFPSADLYSFGIFVMVTWGPSFFF